GKDDAIQKAAKIVRSGSVRATWTYSISLAIMFLDRLGDPDDVALIESLTVRLLAGQSNSGGWSYECPGTGNAGMRRLSEVVRRRNELTTVPELPKGRRPRRTIRDLPREIIQQLEQVGKPGPGGVVIDIGPGDNSNTQFAALALWIGRRHGLPVEQA